MAVPFRRVSKMKKGMRRSHQALSVPGMITYKGKPVVVKATKEDAQE